MGMRSAINTAASLAKGEYLLKCDAHCMFAEGFDEVLKAECEKNWIVIPSRYSLDAENWCIKDTGKRRVDYHYLCLPFDYPGYGKGYDPGLHGSVWNQRGRERENIMLDDEMSFQGSCWFIGYIKPDRWDSKRLNVYDKSGKPAGIYIKKDRW